MTLPTGLPIGPQYPGQPAEDYDDSDDAAKIRLLICHTCSSIDPLPDWDGPLEHDDTLRHRLAQHRYPDGSRHFGTLARVAERSWSDPRYQREILAELARSRAGGETGLGSKFYDVKATFGEDAYRCWNREHGRTENCADYRSDRKRLLADTREERRDLGLPTRARDRPAATFLCDFCPYHSVVTERKRKAKGFY